MKSEGWNIPIRNVFHMLAYAFQALQQGEYTDVSTEDFEHIHDLFAAILVKGVGRQLKQGLLLSICQLVVEGMLITTESGEHRLAQFIDDQRLHRLYEKFILEYYAQEHNELEARASQIPWALDDGMGTLLPVMQSDITLTDKRDPGCVLIIDAKFYAHATQGQYGSRTVHSANLYQFFTYVKNCEAGFGERPHEVGGMLLYARTNEAVQPNQSYKMSGSRIEVRTLDLNQEFVEIASQLDGIAVEYFMAKADVER